MLRPRTSSLLPDPGVIPAGSFAPLRHGPFHEVLWAAGIMLIVVMAVFQVYDILRRQKLVLTKAAVEALAARFADTKPAKSAGEAKR